MFKNKEAEMKISELKPLKYNSMEITKKKYQSIKQSMKRYGPIQKAVINVQKSRYGNIVGGHTRIRIATELGYKVYPCYQLVLNKEQERELNIRLNIRGDFDADGLANNFELPQLENWGVDKRKDLKIFDSKTEVNFKADTKPLKCPECGFEGKKKEFKK